MMCQTNGKSQRVWRPIEMGSGQIFQEWIRIDLTWQGARGKIGPNVSNPLQLTHNMNSWIHFDLTHFTTKQRKHAFQQKGQRYILLVCTFEAVEDVKMQLLRVQYRPIYYLPRRAKTHNVLSVYWSCIISHTSQSINRIFWKIFSGRNFGSKLLIGRYSWSALVIS